MRDRLKSLGAQDIELKHGASGQFDVFIDGKIGYSRHDTGRFPTDSEIDKLAKP